MRPVLILAAILSCVPPAEAAGKTPSPTPAASPEPPALGEVLVTATRSRRPLPDVASSAILIPRSALRAAPAQNVDDLLRHQSGMDVKRVTGMASGIPSRISVRGVPGANRTLALVDGIPLNAAGTGFMGMNEVPLGVVDRVEVVRGPFSSLYGSNAFGGVVNVLTRDPGPSPAASLTGTTGPYGRNDASAGLSMPAGPAGLLLMAERRLADNYLARERTLDRTWDPVTRGFIVTEPPAVNVGYHEERLFGKAVLEAASGTRVTAHAQALRGRLGYGRTVFLRTPEDNLIENHSAMGALRLERALSERVDLSVGGYGRRRFEHVVNESYSRMNPFPPFPVYERTYTDTEYRDWQGDVHAHFRPTESDSFTLGADYLLNEGRFDPARLVSGTALGGRTGSSRSLHNLGVYLQEEWTAGGFRVVPGARFDRDASWGWTFSPRAAALYRVSRAVKLRTSAGRAFRAPTLSELYMPDVSSIPGVILRSNPHLTPETITALDAGAVLEPRDDLVLEVDAFRNDMRDLITLLRAGPTMTYGNLDRARSVGFDSAVAWRPTGAWTLSLNHTWQWVEDRTTGQVLDYMPQNKGHAALRATRTLRGIRFDAQVLESLSGARYYTDSSTRRRVRLDPFAVTNLAVRAGWDDRAFVEVKALNLLDSLYEETGEVPAPGRMVLLTAGAGL